MLSKNQNITLSLAAALTTFASIAFAQSATLDQFSQPVNISGGNDILGYKLSSEWSEDLGFSMRGHYGIMTGQNMAFGLIARIGENVTEGLVNVGFTFGAHYDVILSAGKLRERLPINNAASREWVGQNEFGATLKRDRFTANVYITDSQSTDNYVGARSVGTDLGVEQALSSVTTLSSCIGYQRINWDDGSAIDTGITGSIGISVAAGDNAIFKFVADQNLSERTFGIQSTWNLGLGSLGAGYTQIKGRNGARADNSSVQVTYSIPLGVKSSYQQLARSRVNRGPITSTSILADVMRRPDYLPKRVIAKVEPNTTSVCAAYSLGRDDASGFSGILADDAQSIATLVLISSDLTLAPYPSSVSATNDTFPLMQPSGLYGLHFSELNDPFVYLNYERQGIDDTITFNIGSVECQLSAEVWFFSP